MASLSTEISDDVNRYLNLKELTTLATVSTNSFFRGLNNMKFNRFMPEENGEEILRIFKRREKVKLSDLKESSNINITDQYEETFLHWAIRINDVEMVNFLTNNGSDINFRDYLGETPLYRASEEMFLQRGPYGPSVGAFGYLIRDRYPKFLKETLYIESIENNIKIAKILINSGADINIANANGKTPLFQMTENFTYRNSVDNVELATLLINSGANVNKADIEGRTPLFMAVKITNYDMIKVLINFNADVNKANNKGQTPLQVAIRNKNDEIIQLLKEAGTH